LFDTAGRFGQAWAASGGAALQPWQTGVSPDPSLDTRVTASRIERKYALLARQAVSWIHLFDRYLSRQQGPGGVEQAHQYQTSVYFDTQTRDLFCAASQGLPVAQVRVREYHPVRAAPGAKPALNESRLWLEFKAKSAARVDKVRFALSRQRDHHIVSKLALGWTPDELALKERWSAAGREDLARLITAIGSSLQPDAVVNYRRRAWQDAEGTLRLTLDADIGFFAPRADICSRPGGLERPALGRLLHRHQGLVLEIKSCREPPAWLGRQLRENAPESVTLSKFLLASTVVHAGAASECPPRAP